MKKNLLWLLCPVLFTSCTFFGGGDDDFSDPHQSSYQSVVMPRAEFESSVALLPNQGISKSGKIYIKENLLFINEFRKGFHVFNYSDAANPQPIAFIKIPGATDLAVRNNKIYINHAVDLVTLEYIPQTNSITLVSRNRDIFPPMISPDGFPGNSAPDEIIIDYNQI